MNHFTVHRSVTARATHPRRMYAAPAACALPDSATPASPHTKPRKDVLLSFAYILKAPIPCAAMVMSFYYFHFVSLSDLLCKHNIRHFFGI